jgi:hypothetical protein
MLEIELDFTVEAFYGEISSVFLASEVIEDRSPTIKKITVITSFSPYAEEEMFLLNDPEVTTIDAVKAYYANSRNNGLSEIPIISLPIIETPPPDWDGLYQTLMVSSVYYTLVGLGEQIDAVDGALDKTIDAIQYGIFKPDSVAAMPAFQSAINLLLLRLTNSELELSTEQIAEVRGVLDTNGFNSIQL